MTDAIRQSSRLRFGRLAQLDDAVFWDLLTFPNIPIQRDDIQHFVKDGDQLHLIANLYYGDSNLQWIIARANNIDLWPTGLNQGTTVRVPSPRYVREELFKSRGVKR